jgi:hypothetical protein
MVPYIPAEVLFRHMPMDTDMIPIAMLVCKSWKKEIDVMKESVIFNEFYEKYPFLKNESFMANPNLFDLHRKPFVSFLYKLKKHIDEDQTNQDIFIDILKDGILPKRPTEDQTRAYHTITILLTLYEYSFENTTTKPYKLYSYWICYLLYSYIIRLFIYKKNPICLNVNFINSCRTNIQMLLAQQQGVWPSLKIQRLLRHGLRIIKHE